MFYKRSLLAEYFLQASFLAYEIVREQILINLIKS